MGMILYIASSHIVG